MFPESRQTPVDASVARLASRQHGVISLAQLIELGLGIDAVHKRVGTGRLHRIYQGVYAVGHPALSLDGKRMAAVLACGPGAALSHRDAAAILGLRENNAPKFDVTSPIRTGRRKPGIRIHSGATLSEADTTSVRNIPCTSVPRTLLDLAGIVNQRQIERAIDRAEALALFDLIAINELLARSPGRRGAPKLRRAIAADPVLTRTEIEELMYGICTRARLPRPEGNYPIGKYTADFAFLEQHLIAETDGRATHLTMLAFEHDRLRDRELLLQGWRTVRFTYRQLKNDPDEVAATLRTLLT
jgi:very-short-patch-repair endonuclease